MLTRFVDLDGFTLMDELRRRMDRVWEDFDGDAPRAGAGFASAAFPRLNVFDAGSSLVVTADVPGLTESEVDVTIHEGSLTLSGERKPKTPEGYSVHRQERRALSFSRSVTLPCRVSVEQSTATVKDGVLSVTLAKAPEARPQKITVRAS